MLTPGVPRPLSELGALAQEATAVVRRVQSRLSPELAWLATREVFEILEGLPDVADLLVPGSRVAFVSAAGADDFAVELHFPERFLELVAALRALDRDLGVLVERHAVLLSRKESPGRAPAGSCAEEQAHG